MSKLKDEAVIKFNKLYSVNTIRIPCGLYVLHIASITFDNTTFEKTNLSSEFSLYSHPFNILNLAYYLHCEYSKSNKNNPLKMKIEIINELYKILINYNFKKYQKSISNHWLY